MLRKSKDLLDHTPSTPSYDFDGPVVSWIEVLGSFLLDVVLFVSFMWFPSSMLLQHYVSWCLISQIPCWLVPRQRFLWTVVFRVATSLQLLGLLISLWVARVDVLFSVPGMMRLCTVFFSLSLGIIQCVRLLPHHAHRLLSSFFSFLLSNEPWKSANAPGFIFLALSFVLNMVPNVAYLTHYNADTSSSLDIALVGMQGANAFTVMTKMFFATLVAQNIPWKRAVGTIAVAALFLAQWIIMPTMFTKAPIPYVHISAECGLVLIAILWTKEWLKNA